MLALLLALCALAAGASADCDACVGGSCSSQRPVLRGFAVTDRLAYDHNNRILYLQLNGNLNTAIYFYTQFGDPDFVTNVQLINTMNTKGIAVDKWSNVLYLGMKGEKTVYKYDVVQNTTDTILVWDENKYPDLMYLDKYRPELVFMESNTNGSSFYFIPTDTYKLNRTLTLKYLISDFIINHNKLFFVSNNTLYTMDLETTPITSNKEENIISALTPKLIVKKKQIVLSTDLLGNVYIGDATDKVIYRLQRETYKLEIFAAYEKGYVEDFIITSQDSIIFRDADGSVKKLVKPHIVQHCKVEPPHENFLIKELKDLDYVIHGNYNDLYRDSEPGLLINPDSVPN